LIAKIADFRNQFRFAVVENKKADSKMNRLSKFIG
jgi:hypothetical protein